MLDDRTEKLTKVFANLNKASHVLEFLEDLCTPSEIASMGDRLYAAKLIDEGMSYREIYKKTGVSTATVTRVARCIASGSGGYKRYLNKQGKKK